MIFGHADAGWLFEDAIDQVEIRQPFHVAAEPVEHEVRTEAGHRACHPGGAAGTAGLRATRNVGRARLLSPSAFSGLIRRRCRSRRRTLPNPVHRRRLRPLRSFVSFELVVAAELELSLPSLELAARQRSPSSRQLCSPLLEPLAFVTWRRSNRRRLCPSCRPASVVLEDECLAGLVEVLRGLLVRDGSSRKEQAVWRSTLRLVNGPNAGAFRGPSRSALAAVAGCRVAFLRPMTGIRLWTREDSAGAAEADFRR